MKVKLDKPISGSGNKSSGHLQFEQEHPQTCAKQILLENMKRIFFKFPGKQHFEDLTRHAARATLSTKWRGGIKTEKFSFQVPLQLLERDLG